MLSNAMAERAPPPTLRELSLILKVSPATISLALRNDPRVADKTRERVIAAAHEYGYRMNPAISSLMSQVRSTRRVAYSETIGWLNFWDQRDAYQKTGVEFQRLLWKGALKQAEDLGYSLDNIWMKEELMTQRRATDILTARGIRGLLIPPLPESAALPDMNWSAFSAIAMSYTLTTPHMDRVIPDHFSNMQTICRALLDLGYRRLGLLMPRGYDERTGCRATAAFSQMQLHLPKNARVPTHVSHPEVIEPDTIAWLNAHKPDAVITMGTLKDIKRAPGLDPEYLKRMGLALMSNASSDVNLCGIDENPYIIGMTAVRQLTLSLQNNDAGLPEHPRLILIEGTWVAGDSETAIQR